MGTVYSFTLFQFKAVLLAMASVGPLETWEVLAGRSNIKMSQANIIILLSNISCSIFIGPKSNPCPCHSLTNWCFRDLNDVTLAEEDGYWQWSWSYSNLQWGPQFNQDFEVWSKFWSWMLVKTLRLNFGRDFEAEFWSRFWSWFWSRCYNMT